MINILDQTSLSNFTEINSKSCILSCHHILQQEEQQSLTPNLGLASWKLSLYSAKGHFLFIIIKCHILFWRLNPSSFRSARLQLIVAARSTIIPSSSFGDFSGLCCTGMSHPGWVFSYHQLVVHCLQLPCHTHLWSNFSMHIATHPSQCSHFIYPPILDMLFNLIVQHPNTY